MFKLLITMLFATSALAQTPCGDLALAVPILKNPASKLSPEELGMLHASVLQACDSLDGVKDGILENPDQCDFDPDK